MPRFTSLNLCFLAGLFVLQSLALVAGAQTPGTPSGQPYRQFPRSPEGAGSPAFSPLEAFTAGILFTNLLSEERSLTNQVYLNGSGVAAGDIDGDGWTDLYFCGLDTPNRLYRNLGGWRFVDITEAAGVACADQASTGAVLVDIDGDGDLDLLVNGLFRGTRLFLNDGRGRFEEVTSTSGLRSTAGTASLALADVDGDGLLDIYAVNYRNDTMRDMPNIQFQVGVTNGVYHLQSVNGRPATDPELVGRFHFQAGSGVTENGQPDQLFRNQGGGRFAPQSWTDGTFLDEQGKAVAVPYDWGLSAMFRDINGDGHPDLYVCNDFESPDRIWINDGTGRFQALPGQALSQTSLFSMGIDFADVNRDGHLDFFVADMLSRTHVRRQVQVMAAPGHIRDPIDGSRPQFSRNTLFVNRGDGSYAELAQFSGLEASDWSWTPVFLDVDLDGYEDLLVTTGHWRDAQHADIARELEESRNRRRVSPLEQLRLRKRFPKLDTPNAAFRNRGDLTFEDTSALWGFDSRRISHGLALADLDNDGDLDVIINCLNEAPLLYKNQSSAPRISIRLRGRPPNTHGIGAQVRVRAPGLPVQTQEFVAGGRYLSSDDFVRTFAAGHATNRLEVEVRWRNGAHSLLRDLPANHHFELAEPDTPPALSEDRSPEPLPPFFEDARSLLQHQHADEPFDDFLVQELLPRKLSQLGPGLAWFDFDGDGWDDLLVGTGRGGRLAAFRNTGQGTFVPQRASALQTPAERDLTSVLGWRPGPGQISLLLGLASYETLSTPAPSVRSFSLTSGATDDTLHRSASSTGPLAFADIDRDGDLDLFIGGRLIPRQYPAAASSALLRNDEGTLRADPALSAPLAEVGLVSAALFTDLDLDGWPDLVLTCEWGPVRVFRNVRGILEAWDAPLRWNDGLASRTTHLSTLTGWWNSVAAGDFDGDGRFDLVVGNWGRNTARQRFLEEPLVIHYGDPEEIGRLALLEGHFDPDLRRYVPTRDWSAVTRVFPQLLSRYPNFTAFSTASLEDLLTAVPAPMRKLSVSTLDSLILLNRGDHFLVRPLPVEAQFSPVFGLAAGDLDGDGHEDLFLAQNFFDSAPPESRHDAGKGLWLRGDGTGGFQAVPNATAGFSADGAGRAVALSDFDGDGRLDLAVAQNRGPTHLYRNRGATPGLRVHLRGPPRNPQAVGAIIRPIYANGHSGPAREIRLGEGYWAQHSAVQVLGNAAAIRTLEIRWPHGPVEQVPVPTSVRSITREAPAIRE